MCTICDEGWTVGLFPYTFELLEASIFIEYVALLYAPSFLVWFAPTMYRAPLDTPFPKFWAWIGAVPVIFGKPAYIFIPTFSPGCKNFPVTL